MRMLKFSLIIGAMASCALAFAVSVAGLISHLFSKSGGIPLPRLPTLAMNAKTGEWGAPVYALNNFAGHYHQRAARRGI